MIRDITFTVDEELLDDAHDLAQEENTTLNEQFRMWLESYARKRRAARATEVLDRLGRYVSSGGRKFTREDVNERR